MASPDDALSQIDTLIQVAMRLAASAPSGRIALAKLATAVAREWIPRPWNGRIWPELERARQAAVYEPVPARQVERILQEAWGAKPTEELDELDTEPVALTPTSQVHRGKLDGEPVAVKVLRPGLAAGVRQDLVLLEGLAGPLGAAFPGLDPAALLGEVRERVLDEFDLEHEAGMQRRFQRALRGHPALVVPAPVTRLSHESVLVSQWVDGVPLPEAEDPDLAAQRLVAFALGGIRSGLVYADPDPQDVLELPDGRTAILDYGATKTVEAERADAGLALVEAFADDDSVAFGRALARLGALPEEQGEKALALARRALGDLGRPGPHRLDSSEVVGIGRRIAGRPEETLEILLGGSIAPEDLWPLRGVGLAFAVAAREGVTGAWLDLTLAALREGWDAAA